MAKSPKLRRHGTAPANWQYRDGRPAWIPSPTRRKAGWRRLDLKAADGAWMSEGASIDEAKRVNAAVDAWARGELVPARYAPIAPAGAAEQPGRGQPLAQDKLSIGALIDAFAGDPARRIEPCEEFRAKAPATQADYRHKLKRFVDVLAGWAELPARGDVAAAARYAAAVAEARADSIFVLAPEEGPDGIEDLLLDVYRTFKRCAGQHQATGVMAVVSLWLTWCRQRKTRRIVNWAMDVKREAPGGRIRVWSWDEIYAMVEAADAMGLPSIGDSVILGVDLSWNQIDRLNLRWNQIRNGRVHASREKTGNVGEPALLEIGLRRLAMVQERQKAMAASPTHVLWCERTKAPWKPYHYRHVFAEVRAEAAKACPSILHSNSGGAARDQDLRDTAVTVAYEADLSLPEICSRTLHTLARAQAVLDAHYGAITRKIGDAAKAKLDAYLCGAGVRL